MQPDGLEFPRIIVTALRGGSAKTILSIGIIAALSKLGKSIAPFKKGPDYIDAGRLALAAGRPCYNLDSFLLSRKDNLQSFLTHSRHRNISIIEGNRGLYDGIDLEGSTSTAALGKLLQCPVVLCLDCTKITRTMAAVVMGCFLFDPDVMINAVILNRVANLRHEKSCGTALNTTVVFRCSAPFPNSTSSISQNATWGWYPHLNTIGPLIPLKRSQKSPEHHFQPESGEVVIQIKPGAAFGDGRHPTTRLAIRGIEYVLKEINNHAQRT
jgi:hypothetical protein